MADEAGFVYCGALDGEGGAREITSEFSQAWKKAEGTVWFHLDLSFDQVREWMTDQSGLSEVTAAMLVSEDTRPRITAADNGLVICLRGVNCNPGSDPDDMVSLRLWISGNRIVTLRHRRVEAINDIRTALASNAGPTDSGGFLETLCDSLTGRIADVVGEIEEGVDALEDELLQKERATLRTEILKYRRMIVGLRKYVVPQRETLSRLPQERVAWISDLQKLQLRESAERTTRCIDDLDAARDRAAMAQEELNARLSEQMNQTIFMMSIVATIFLPLGLLTGLLGINVGGIPGADTPWAFVVVCGLLVIIASGLYWLFKRKQII